MSATNFVQTSLNFDVINQTKTQEGDNESEIKDEKSERLKKLKINQNCV